MSEISAELICSAGADVAGDAAMQGKVAVTEDAFEEANEPDPESDHLLEPGAAETAELPAIATTEKASGATPVERMEGPSKREKRRAKEAQKKAEEAERLKASKGRNGRQQTESDLAPDHGKGSRRGKPPSRSETPIQLAKPPQVKMKKKAAEAVPEVTELDLQKVIRGIEDKCEKLEDRWASEWTSKFHQHNS